MAKKEKAPARTKLTRQDMEDIIKRGGSVMHQSEIITDLADLPDEVDLAETEEEIAAAQEATAAAATAAAAKATKAAAKKPAARPAAKK